METSIAETHNKSCSVLGCDGKGWTSRSGSKTFTKGYCKKHYARQRNGNNPHQNTKYDKRPAIIEGDIAKIPLGAGASKGYAIVDKDFAWLADKHLWSMSYQGYAIATVDGKTIRMHHAIVGKPPKGMDTDHINRVKADNRKENLRFVSRSVNVHNVGLRSHNTSGHKNICWNKSKRKWIVQIVVAQEVVLSKQTDDLNFAIKIRDEFRQLIGLQVA